MCWAVLEREKRDRVEYLSTKGAVVEGWMIESRERESGGM